MTAVWLLADVPVPPSQEEDEEPGFLRCERAPIDADQRTALLRKAADDLADHGGVVVLHPAWDAVEAARTVRLLRTGLCTVRVVGVAVDLPPLALGVLAVTLAGIARRTRALGRLLAAVPLVAADLTAGAWASSAGGDTRRAPRLWSLLPWTRFLVTSPGGMTVTCPGPRTEATDAGARLARAERIPKALVWASPPWHVPDGSTVVLAGRRRDLPAARQVVVSILRDRHAASAASGSPAPVGEVPVRGDDEHEGGRARVRLQHLELPRGRAAGRVGPLRARRCVELTVRPRSPRRLAELAEAAFDGRPCVWCGEIVATSPCPLCRMVADAPLPPVVAARPPREAPVAAGVDGGAGAGVHVRPGAGLASGGAL